MRDELKAIVGTRATHASLDAVTDTLERWAIEQLLQKEYHGRFLFELVQNAVDAFHRRYPERDDGFLHISLRDRRLIVANEGEYLTPDVVVHSLSKVGQSTKPEGTSIGHKGIGFKSVLEVSLSPRLYSREDAGGDFTLRVRYDPDKAIEAVKAGTVNPPGWDAMVTEAAELLGIEPDPRKVPILRFPIWDEAPPDWISESGEYLGHGFNTIVALEHDPRFDAQLGMDEMVWESRVRRAATDLTDEVVLLLGSLGTIVLDGFGPAGAITIGRSTLRSTAGSPTGTMKVAEISLNRNGR